MLDDGAVPVQDDGLKSDVKPWFVDKRSLAVLLACLSVAEAKQVRGLADTDL